MRYKKLRMAFATVLCLAFIIDSYAQKEGSIWYFGDGNGVNFNQACDIEDLSSSMDGLEGTVSLSDENGDLLFYTNGGRRISDPSSSGIIWNRNHEIMYDMGTTEGGGASARQSSLAIPKPGDPNHYYLFTLDENEAINAGTFRGFSYFEIDMDLNGGLGGVIDYQGSVSAFPFGNEGMAGVIRPDGNSYWVVILSQNGFEYYLVDQNGVNLDHTQAFNTTISVSPFTFSPNGEYVSFGSNVLEFDTETGLFSNETNFLISGISPVGSAFSPNSRYFFVSQIFGNSVYRFDMEAADILGSLTEIYTLSPTTICGNILPAPDGNMYFLHTDPVNNPNQVFFSAILCPNSENPCVKEAVYVFPLNSSTLSPGLPNYLDHYFMSDVVERGLEICVDASAAQICPGQEVTLTAEHYLAETIDWSTGESGGSITVTEPGIYTVTISDGCCNTEIEEIEILSDADGLLTLELNGPNVICDNIPISLSAASQFAIEYQWSTGNNTPEIEVSSEGTYSVTVTDVCGSTLSSEINVSESEALNLDLQIEGDLSCAGQAIATVTTNATNISWSTGENSNQITLTEPGTYSVEVENLCDMQSEAFTLSPNLDIFEMPNAFTPNGDGISDIFRPVWGCSDITNFSFKIFNRWGNKVFESTDPLTGWNGLLNNEPAVSDVFIYTISFQASNSETVQTSGDVTLIR